MMRAVAAFLLLLCLGNVALAETTGDPVAVVRGLYPGYERGKPITLEKQPFSRRMRKLLAADKAYAKREVGRLDFRPDRQRPGLDLAGLPAPGMSDIVDKTGL